LTNDDLRATYDTVAADYARIIPGLSAESPLEIAFLDRFADEVATRGGLVADIGCGPGRITAYLASRDVNAYGIDLSPMMIAVAAKAHPELRFETGAMSALPIEDGVLAGALAWYSTIHTPVEELPGVYREFARVLAPGGVLLIGFHAGSGVVKVTRSYGHEVDVELQLFDAAELTRLLTKAGFAVDATLVREAVGGERRPQGFLLAHKGIT
jgi:SAM-dependent methyltransferase